MLDVALMLFFVFAATCRRHAVAASLRYGAAADSLIFFIAADYVTLMLPRRLLLRRLFLFSPLFIDACSISLIPFHAAARPP